jgi:Protein of unknown function (DUF3017)
MANRPANAGSGRALTPMGDAAPLLDATAPPPPVHHDAVPRTGAPRPGAPRTPAGHHAARHRPSRPSRESRPSRPPRGAGPSGDPGTSGLAWLPYLIVLAGAATGMFVAWLGPKYAGRGTGLVGCSLLAAALARLILPARYAGLLCSRRKASDVLAFAVFGTAVLAVALMLP